MNLTITYNMGFRDYLAYNFYHLARSPITLGLIAIFLVIGVKPNLDSVIKLVSDHSLTYQVIYLYVSQHGAVTIPRRAFESEQQWNQFWDELQSRVKAAKDS